MNLKDNEKNEVLELIRQGIQQDLYFADFEYGDDEQRRKVTHMVNGTTKTATDYIKYYGIFLLKKGINHFGKIRFDLVG
jgi:hypothetical protein